MSTVLSGSRFAEITPDDHAGSVWIASLLCLIYSVLTLVLRGHLRRRRYGVDDFIALAATLIQVGEVAATLVGLHHGLGKTQELLRQGELSTAGKATFAAQILYILSAAAAKAATLALMMRLFNLSGTKTGEIYRQKIFYWLSIGVLGVVALWAILSIVALSVDCSASDYIEADRGSCSRQFLRWQLITAFDVVTEGILILIVVCVVWPVHLALAMKFQVVLAFLFRLPVVVLSILHLHYISNYTQSSNPGVAIVAVIVIQQVQLCWSLISSTIPNLKSFVKSFSSGFGIQLDPSLTQAYGSGRLGRTTNGYEMGSFGANGTLKSKTSGRLHGSNHNEEPMPNLVPNEASSDSKITSFREHDSIDSGGSQGSRDHIIRKEMHWDVHYENQAGRAL